MIKLLFKVNWSTSASN